MLLWFKALHIFFMLAWMAGIFYLPRLMVYNAASDNPDVKQQLNIMQRDCGSLLLPSRYYPEFLAFCSFIVTVWRG